MHDVVVIDFGNFKNNTKKNIKFVAVVEKMTYSVPNPMFKLD